LLGRPTHELYNTSLPPMGGSAENPKRAKAGELLKTQGQRAERARAARARLGKGEGAARLGAAPPQPAGDGKDASVLGAPLQGWLYSGGHARGAAQGAAAYRGAGARHIPTDVS